MARTVPSRLTPSYLENAALHYLERFSSSSANLRRVLMRKAQRSLAHWGGEAGEAASMIDQVIAKLAGEGWLDDAAYARTKSLGLHRRGCSGRIIRATLAAKGVDPELAGEALAALNDESETPELTAAVSLARRRKLGPFRSEDNRAALRKKDLAALARAGFDFDTARQVIDATDSDDLIG